MNFKIFGLNKLTAKLKRLSAPELTKELEKTTRKATFYVHGKLPSESSIPQPAGSTYKRTGNMVAGINTDVKTMGSNVIGLIGTPISYAPWVISSEKIPGKGGPQARVHKGRWYTLQAHVKKYQKDINKFFEDLVKRLIR